jgi:DNA helicase-2/ATP-dependent DNA helicase PcrA
VANVTLSFSDLKYFFECPYQFKLRILYGFNPPIHEALGYGKSLHDALAEVHARALRGEAVQGSAAPALVETHLNLPYAYKELRTTLQQSAERVVADYIADNARFFAHSPRSSSPRRTWRSAWAMGLRSRAASTWSAARIRAARRSST